MRIGEKDMSRVKDAIAEYKEMKNNAGEEILYASDYEEIKDISLDAWELVNNSFMAGFMLGYRSGKDNNK